MSEDPETNLANTGIEYGGWGLLLLYAIKRCFVIARTNGIHIAFGSPCAISFVLDTNPGHPPGAGEGDIEMAEAQIVEEGEEDDDDDSG
jgi:hypothetical protein